MPAAKRKKNKRRRRHRDFHVRNMEILANDSFKYQQHKSFLKEVEKHERDVLNRTIFVTNIKNVTLPSNLALLKSFFERNYGIVEKCVVAEFSGKNMNRSYPPAKITFKSVRAIISLFGKPLDEVKKDRNENFKLIPAFDIAHNGKYHPGKLKIFPSKPSRQRKVVDEETDPLSKSFYVSSISMGHWVPEDSGLLFLEEGSGKNVSTSNYSNHHIYQDANTEFLEEFTGFVGAKVTIDLKRRLLLVRIDDFFDSFIITFRIKNLQSSLYLGCEETSFFESNYSLLFTSTDPPKIQRFSDNSLEVSERVTGIQNAPFDRCLGFKLNLTNKSLKMVTGRHDFSQKMRNFGLLNATALEDALSISSRRLNFHSDKKMIDIQLQKIPSRKIGFLMRSVLDKGKVCWYDALYDRAEISGCKMNVFELVGAADFGSARAALEYLCEMPRGTRFPFQVVRNLISDLEIVESANKPHYCMELPRVMVTPTKILFQGFDMEMSNRVVRNFTQDDLTIDDFLRVSFCEENGDRLFSDDMKSIDIINRFRTILLSGLSVNGNTYKFLSYSSSQLKESSVWMVNSSRQHNIVQVIRDWMGDFSAIKVPSKYAARMGQCFSTTIQTLSGTNQSDRRTKYDKMRHLRMNDSVPDIVCKNYLDIVHSDGTGLIRKNVVAKVLSNVPFAPSDPDDVSIIQIRCGGAKGTLTAWDFDKLPSTPGLLGLRSSDICLRPSMIKFPAEYRYLEVIKVGKHVPYYLNRQMIMLLDHHNVPQSEFLQMQRNMLDNLDSMLSSRSKALEILPHLGGADSSITGLLLHGLASGFSPEWDPFLFSCLHAVRNHHLTNLRKKSRIHVEKGAVLLGGLDETRKLPDGCIFVQLQQHGPLPNVVGTGPDSNPFVVLTGPVLVAKHPVAHPGDIRMLLAVDIPELRHHKNMILFSQNGVRPEADKMAGSDLDGDEFAVTWDERLFLKHWNGCQRLENGHYKTKQGEILKATIQDHGDLEYVNYPPMDFSNQQTPKTVQKVEDIHLVDHFIRFSQADTLGRISMMWLDYASKNQSAACEQCIQLAKLYSIAVDFPKSGVPAVIPRALLIPSTNPRAHWREKKEVDSYQCESTVGKLYDSIVMRAENKSILRQSAVAGRRFNKQGQLLCFMSKDANNLQNHLNEIYRVEIVERLGLLPKSSTGQESAVEQICEDNPEFVAIVLFSKEQRDRYEDELISMMNRYRIHSEGELLTGCVNKFHRLNKRRQHDLAEEVRRQCRQLRNDFREAFLLKVLKGVLHKEDFEEVEKETLIACADSAATMESTKILGKIASLRAKANERGVEIDINAYDIDLMRQYARKLAAAYYMVTYNPAIRDLDIDDNDLDVLQLLSSMSLWDKENSEKEALFSFPHIVFDILNIGLSEV